MRNSIASPLNAVQAKKILPPRYASTQENDLPNDSYQDSVLLAISKISGILIIILTFTNIFVGILSQTIISQDMNFLRMLRSYTSAEGETDFECVVEEIIL